MRAVIRKKNLEITPALASYVEAKLLKPLQKFLGGSGGSDLPIFDLEIGRTTRHHRKGRVYRVTGSIMVGKKLMRAEVEDEDVRAACDLLKEELEREIKHFKEGGRAKTLRLARRLKKDIHLAREARLYRKGRIRDEGN